MAANKLLPISPFGRRLLEAAETAGFTQSQLEREAGFPRGRLSRIIHRPQAMMDFDALARLIDMTGVRTDWLLFERGPMRDEGLGPSDLERAIVAARLEGIVHRVIWSARLAAPDIAIAWSKEEWLKAFRAAQKRDHNDPARSTHQRRLRQAKRRRTRLEELTDDE